MKVDDEVVIDVRAEENEQGLWIVLYQGAAPYDRIGPFDTQEEVHRAHDDLQSMLLSVGAKYLSPSTH